MTMGIQGLGELRARLESQIPQSVMESLRDQIEKEAEKLVGQMQAKVTQDGIKIDWTWGDTPAGAISIGKVRSTSYARLAVTVYAMGFSEDFPLPGGFPAIARWAEFGTADRFQKSGKYTGRIQKGAYFYPTYRERRRNIGSNITRAVKRGIKNA